MATDDSITGEPQDPTPLPPPLTDELVNLQQAVDILRCVEELGKHGDFEDDTPMIVDVIKVARRLIVEALDAFRAYFTAQGGAT